MSDIQFNAVIEKVDPEKRLVYGWASVVVENGQPVIDRHGDIIPVDVLVEAVHKFNTEVRNGGVMHIRNEGEVVKIATVVESIVFTEDLQKTLGIDLAKVGWFLGMRIEHDKVWEMVKSGELKAFSIGGRGLRQSV